MLNSRNMCRDDSAVCLTLSQPHQVVSQKITYTQQALHWTNGQSKITRSAPPQSCSAMKIHLVSCVKAQESNSDSFLSSTLQPINHFVNSTSKNTPEVPPFLSISLPISLAQAPRLPLESLQWHPNWSCCHLHNIL